MGLMEMGANVALGKIRKDVVNPKIATLGTVEEISLKDKKIYLKLLLRGLERPIEAVAEEISILPDGSGVSVGKFTSPVEFVHNGLNIFAAGKRFDIPEDYRSYLKLAKNLLGL